MACEIVVFSVWTRKDGVLVFSTSKQAVDHRLSSLSDLPPKDVSKVNRHRISIEDAVKEEKCS